MSIISASTTSTTAYKVTADTTGKLDFQTGSTPTTYMTLDASGNLGIGASSPLSKLHLNDSTGTAVNLIRMQTAWSNPSGNKSIVWADGTDVLGRISVSYSSPTAKMTFGSLYSSGYQTGDLMTLDASGNLGIGTTSPAILSYRVINAVGSGTSQGGLLNLDVSDGSATFRLYSNSSGATISMDDNLPMVFNTNGTERARIDSSGNLMVGTTSASARLTTVTSGNNVAGFFKNDTSGYQTVTLQNAGGSGTRYLAWFVAGTTDVGSINSNGTTTTYSTSSDYRLKDITGPVTGYKERLSALQPKQGSWKADGSEFRGFLAHEFAVSYPASVNGEKDAVDENGNPRYQGMQAGSAEVVADLVAMIQEQQAIIETLTNRITALEAK